jgi:hypothetical protein
VQPDTATHLALKLGDIGHLARITVVTHSESKSDDGSEVKPQLSMGLCLCHVLALKVQ